jgi:acetyl-CoA synthetase
MSSLHKVPDTFAATARVRREDYQRLYRESLDEPQAFWARMAQRVDWIRPPARIRTRASRSTTSTSAGTRTGG